MLWNLNGENQRSLIVHPTHRGVPSNQVDDDEIERIRGQRSRLFYNRGMRWATQSVLCATTPNRNHGGVSWSALIHTNEDLCFVLSLWLNSTIGFLIHWTQGMRQDPGRARVGSKAVSEIPIPNFEELSENDIQKAKNYFNELSSSPLDVCTNVHIDANRISIDNAILDVMGIPQAQPILDRIRELWSQEPTLRGIHRS